MLKNLSIQNYALISHLEINFSSGFSVITGETGAGKSIIMGALALILGQRADARSIKQGENKCFIEGLFDISSYNLQSFFEERDLDYDTQNCILRREIWNSGKSRAFINDTPVSLNDLKELGSFLIDIHSQHENLLLGDNKFQLQVLDTLADNKNLREEYVTAYSDFRQLKKKFQQLKEKAETDSAEKDYIQFQFNQLNDAKLKADEQTELEKEQEILAHLEEIKTKLYTIEQLLQQEDKGIITSLKESLNIALSLNKVYPFSKEIRERVETAYLDLKDMFLDINNQQEKLELDPERLEWINERLDLLYSLQQKHKVDSTNALIALRDQLEAQLQEIENYDEELAQLQKQLETAKNRVGLLAEKLTKTRQKAAIHLEKSLIEKVSVLGMPFMRFSCQIIQKETPDKSGVDDISFLFSANKNGELKPVAQTASGGEISRLMLGIKALVASSTALPTIIFDEIDSGVSGEVADKMAAIMQQMGKVMQVIAITHLPQIAAKGDSQFFVYKEEKDKFTETHIRPLTDEERIKEIAQMLSGSKLTDAAIENAKELLK